MVSKFYEERICPECQKEHQVRKWTNPSGICRSCSARKAHPKTKLSNGFARGEELGKACKTIYFWKECPQCHNPRWVIANLRGAITPNRLCRQCVGFNIRESKERRGEKNSHWRGGRPKTTAGYIQIYSPDHPRVKHQSRPYVFEHIIVWEQANGRFLPSNWVIHHLNGIKADNRIENLLAMPNHKHSVGLYVKVLQERIRKLEQLHLL